MTNEQIEQQLTKAATEILSDEADEFTSVAHSIVREGKLIGLTVTVVNETYARTEAEIDGILDDYAAVTQTVTQTSRLKRMTAHLRGED